MGKAGGIIGILAGIFGVIAAVVTLFLGGIGSAFKAQGASTLVGLGWGGIIFSFLTIVFGAVCIARPRGGGVGLALSSICGAILGGTLVAVCMVLAFIGGILALVDSKKAQVTSSVDGIASPIAQPAGRKLTWVWVCGGAIIAFIALAIAVGSGIDKPKTDPLAEIAGAQPSALRPDGELSEIFALGSKSTNLQRESKLKEIQGQIVEWTLPVYEVSRTGDNYKIQTKNKSRFGSSGTATIGSFIVISPRNDEERRQIEALKTDDLLSFKGRIAGSTLRNIEIKPAILASAAPPPVQQAALPSPTPAPSQAAAPIQNPPATIETAYGKVSIEGDSPKKLFIDGKPFKDDKGKSLENDDVHLVKDFNLAGELGMAVVVLYTNCGGSACSQTGRYHFLMLNDNGSRWLSAEFGDGTENEPTLRQDGKKIILDFGAKGTAILDSGKVRISKELLSSTTTEQAPATVSNPIIDLLQASTAADATAVDKALASVEALPPLAKGDRKKSRELNKQGLDYVKSADYSNAIGLFKEAKAVDESDVEVIGNLGFAQLKAGQITEAELTLLNGLRVWPRGTGMWASLGQVYAKKDQQNNSIGSFSNAFRFSKSQEKTLEFLRSLAEADVDLRVRSAANATLRSPVIAESIARQFKPVSVK